MRTRFLTVRCVVLLLASVFISFQSNSQAIGAANGKVEIGIGIGPSFFLGDLGGTRGEGRTFVKDVNFPFTKLMKGIYLNVYPTEWLGFRVSANIGELEAFDSIITNHGGEELFRKKRNLDFKSKLSEAYIAAELYPTVFLEKYDGLLHKIRPYGVFGIGVFHFNPQGIYIAPNGTRSWVNLKPLRLEGQGMAEYPDRKPYSLTQLEIPMGFGVKYYIKENMYVGFEILHRKTFTDYIDDVSKTYIDPSLFDQYLTPSQAIIARQLEFRENMVNPSVNRIYINEQRGNPNQNDAYFSGMLRFGWRLGSTQDRHLKKQLKCPHFF